MPATIWQTAGASSFTPPVMSTLAWLSRRVGSDEAKVASLFLIQISIKSCHCLDPAGCCLPGNSRRIPPAGGSLSAHRDCSKRPLPAQKGDLSKLRGVCASRCVFPDPSTKPSLSAAVATFCATSHNVGRVLFSPGSSQRSESRAHAPPHPSLPPTG